MSAQTITVVGMTCNGCATKVTNAVSGVEGVRDVDVDITTGEVSFEGTVDVSAVHTAVERAGYRVSS